MDIFLLNAAITVCKIFLLFKIISIAAYIVIKIVVTIICICMIVCILKSILR